MKNAHRKSETSLNIALRVGWKCKIDTDGFTEIWTDPKDNRYRWLVNTKSYPFPNYCECLNAMHDAVMTLSTQEKRVFESKLQSVAFETHLMPCELEARHHAEAFLRVFTTSE